MIFIIFTSVNVYSQTDTEVDTDYDSSIDQEYEVYLNLLEFSFSNQIPLETFKENLSGTSFGFRFAYYNNFSGKDNLFWALHYQSFRIAKLSNTFTVNEQFASYRLNSKAISNIIFTGYGLRYYFDFYSPKLEPFAELKLGLNSVYSYTSDTVDGSEEASIDFENFDMTFAYAVGLGVQYNVRKGQALHLIANFNGSNNSTYYIVEDQGLDYPWDNFDKKVTQIDYLQIYFGLTFGF